VLQSHVQAAARDRACGAARANMRAPGGLPPALAPALEAQMRERRVHIDKVASVVAFLQIAMGALDAVSRAGCRAVLFGSLALHAGHAWLIFGPRSDWYAAHRTAVAVSLLAAVRLLTALAIQGCNNPTTQARDAWGREGAGGRGRRGPRVFERPRRRRRGMRGGLSRARPPASVCCDPAPQTTLGTRPSLGPRRTTA
jgi:hypothetical protein